MKVGKGTDRREREKREKREGEREREGGERERERERETERQRERERERESTRNTQFHIPLDQRIAGALKACPQKLDLLECVLQRMVTTGNHSPVQKNK